MEVWNQPTIDIGLTILGYLVATALGIVIHSALSNRRRVKADKPQAAAPEVAITAPMVERPTTKAVISRDTQFLSLRSDPRPTQKNRPTARPTVATPQARRDRIEMIRLAKEMLKAGTDGAMIQRTLPISDAELAMLQTANTD